MLLRCFVGLCWFVVFVVVLWLIGCFVVLYVLLVCSSALLFECSFVVLVFWFVGLSCCYMFVV